MGLSDELFQLVQAWSMLPLTNQSGHLVSYAGVARPDSQCALEHSLRLVVALVLFEEGLSCKFETKSFAGPVLCGRRRLPRPHRRGAVPGRSRRTHRKLRIELRGLFRSTRPGEFLRVHFRGAEQQARFGRFAVTQDAVHQQLAARGLIIADQSRAQQVNQRLVVWGLLFQRCK